MNSGGLADKLKSLGVQLGARDMTPRTAGRYPIETVLAGELEKTALGDVFFTHKEFENGYIHGLVSITSEFEFPLHSRWAGVPEGETIAPSDVLFLDTETTGLAGGAGTLVFMVGVGFFEAGKFHLFQLFLKTPADAAAFINKLGNIAGPKKALCTYNGKSFDIPLLNNQCILNHIPPFFKGKPHYDLLPLARRLWSNRLNDRSLKEIESVILGVRRSTEEIPGWMIPEIYTDYLRSGDSRPLSGVFYHNEIDILSLAGLFIHTAGMLASPFDSSELPLVDIFSIARFYEDLGEIERSYELFHYCINKNIERPFLSRAANILALRHRRRDEWEQAVRFWEIGASQNDSFACIELAKYYEHIVRDYSLAYEWCLKANILSQHTNYYHQVEKQFRHRQARLEKKMHAGKEMR